MGNTFFLPGFGGQADKFLDQFNDGLGVYHAGTLHGKIWIREGD